MKATEVCALKREVCAAFGGEGRPCYDDPTVACSACQAVAERGDSPAVVRQDMTSFMERLQRKSAELWTKEIKF